MIPISCIEYNLPRPLDQGSKTTDITANPKVGRLEDSRISNKGGDKRDSGETAREGTQSRLSH